MNIKPRGAASIKNYGLNPHARGHVSDKKYYQDLLDKSMDEPFKPKRHFINQFHENWVLYREDKGVEYGAVLDNMIQQGLSETSGAVRIRQIESGRVFVPMLIINSDVDYTSHARNHAEYCQITQDVLDEFAQYLPKPEEGKLVTPVDISTLLI